MEQFINKIRTIVEKENRYLSKYFSFLILGFVMRILAIFPIKKNRVSFTAYTGKSYSCSPRYISENMENSNAEIIWFFKDIKKHEYLKDRGIKVCKYDSFMHLYYTATSAVCVDNGGGFGWNPIRKKQIHLTTWHGGGLYKKTSNDVNNASVYWRKFNRLHDINTTHFLSSSKKFTEIVIGKAHPYFKGAILEYGLPRNDIFFDDNKIKEAKRKVVEELGIEDNLFIVLYAPTWRENGDQFIPNYSLLREAVLNRFGRECVILIRSHYLSEKFSKDSGIIDVSHFEDMQELLCTADMLLTDYSSSIWDYSYTYRPCFLFVKDLLRYERDVGFESDIHTWGFPVCMNDEELIEAINNYNEYTHRKNMDTHHDKLGSFESGNSTNCVCDFINNYLDSIE